MNAIARKHIRFSLVMSFLFRFSIVMCSAQQGGLNLTNDQRDQLLSPTVDTLRQLYQRGEPAVMQYLQSLSLGSLDQTGTAENGNAVSGASLSTPFFGSGAGFNSDKLLDGVDVVSSTDEYTKSIILFSVIEDLLNAQDPQLVQWLANRSTQVPATRGDLLVISSLPDGLNGFAPQFWSSSAQQWKSMLIAKNPAYRLLALQNARFFESDASTLLNDYRRGLQEKNTILQNAAFEGLSFISNASARAILQNFLSGSQVGNDGTMPPGFDINSAVRAYLGNK